MLSNQYPQQNNYQSANDNSALPSFSIIDIQERQIAQVQPSRSNKNGRTDNKQNQKLFYQNKEDFSQQSFSKTLEFPEDFSQQIELSMDQLEKSYKIQNVDQNNENGNIEEQIMQSLEQKEDQLEKIKTFDSEDLTDSLAFQNISTSRLFLNLSQDNIPYKLMAD